MLHYHYCYACDKRWPCEATEDEDGYECCLTENQVCDDCIADEQNMELDDEDYER